MVTSLENITVNPGGKWKQKGEEQDTDQNWEKENGPGKPGCCDQQHSEENNRSTTTNMSSEINICDMGAVWSVNKNTNSDNQDAELSSTYL